LINWEVSDTGRKLTGRAQQPPLCTGITKAVFRRSGMSPLERILWKSVVKAFAWLYLHFFRGMEGIPSGPGAEFAESNIVKELTILII
jgi:hypothetical protein